jgi:peptidyl-tRNA hydrolase
MDSMTISFDIKGMVNGKYLIAASAIAISVTYIATSARELISKWLDNRSRKSVVEVQSKPNSGSLPTNIIEDYKVNI